MIAVKQKGEIMKATLFLLALCLCVTFSFASQAYAKNDKELFMATTTSTADTGLLDYLAPIFKKDTGYSLKFVSVGTGEAIAMGKNGDVSIILVHAKAREEDFVKGGFGVKRFPVMYNDFVIIGPKSPIQKNDDIQKTFTTIMEQKLPFISRGDNSGTNGKELSIWKQLKLDPTKNPNYQQSGQGMGATISMADEKKAYTLTDRGTWLKISNDANVKMELGVVCEGNKSLFNQYGIIAVNPKKYPDTNIKAADAFINWIVSEKVQKLISQFGVDKYGQALFIPNAGTNN